MLEGEVLQQPTIPVVKETNMMKKATMNKAIMARPMSEIKKIIEMQLDFWTVMEHFRKILKLWPVFGVKGWGKMKVWSG